MRLGDANPTTVKILTIITAVLFVMFALMFFISAKQLWRKNPLRAIGSFILGVAVLVFSAVCTYFLLT